MSEKRFKLRNAREVSINYPNTERVYDYEKGDFLYNREIEYLLNSLVEEKEQLKQENERLIEKRGELETKNVILKKENEQLKKQLEIRTESDKYHQRMLLKWLCKDEDEDEE